MSRAHASALKPNRLGYMLNWFLRLPGLRVVIYPNNHRPAHVHVIGSDMRPYSIWLSGGPIELRELRVSTQTAFQHRSVLTECLEHLCKCGRKSMGSRDNFKLANQRPKSFSRPSPELSPLATTRKIKASRLVLSSNLKVSFSPRHAQGLEKATPSQLQKIEISPSGFGIHFPKLDADLYLPAILQGFFGSRKWMASQLGQVGGKSRSVAKRAASRANGKLGGRPRQAGQESRSGR